MLNGWVPTVLISTAGFVWVYLSGVRELRRRRHRGGPVSWWRVASVTTGLAVFVAAAGSPWHEIAGRSFALHMVQHVVLMVVAPPLLVAGSPLAPIWTGLPPTLRAHLAVVTRRISRWWLSAWWMPLVVAINAVVLWTWHIPAAWQLALTSEPVHAIEHASLMGVSLLLWWTVFMQRRTSDAMSAVLGLFAVAFQGGILAALISFSTQVWYPTQSVAHLWGLDPLTDQRVAGAVMWAMPSAVYVLGALGVLATWLQRESAAHTRPRTDVWTNSPRRA